MSTAEGKTTTRNQRPSIPWSNIVGVLVIGGGFWAYSAWDKQQEKAAEAESARILTPAEVTAAMAPLSQPVRMCMIEKFGDGSREFNNGPFQDSIELCKQREALEKRQAERVQVFKGALAP